MYVYQGNNWLKVKSNPLFKWIDKCSIAPTIPVLKPTSHSISLSARALEVVIPAHTLLIVVSDLLMYGRHYLK